MVACALLLMVVGAGVLRAAEPTGFPIVSTFTSSELGFDAQSFSITQDRDGSLLVGGNTLLAFDGAHWTSTAIEGAYGLRGLDVGTDGRLWVGAEGEIGFFERDANWRWKFNSLRSFLPPRTTPLTAAWYVFAQPGGAVFVTEDEILRWNGRTFEVWHMPGTRRLPAMRVNGTIYVDYVREGLFELTANGPKLFIPEAALGDRAVMALQARDDGWLLTTHKGLLLYRAGKLEPFAPEVSAILVRDVFTSAALLPDGRIVYGTFKGGIVIMHNDGTLARTLDEHDGLPSRSIRLVYVDLEGHLWVSSASAFFCLDLNSASTLFDTRAQLPPLAYRSIDKYHDRILLGTENGIYESSSQNNDFSHYGSMQETVLDLRVTDEGVVTGLFHGAARITPVTAERIYESKTDVAAIGVARSHETLLGANRDIVRVSPDHSSRIIVRDLPDIPRSMVEDEEGNLWIGTIARGALIAHLDPEKAVTARSAGAEFALPQLHGRTFVRRTAEGGITVFADNGGWIKPAHETYFRPIRNYPARGIGAAADFAADGTSWVAHTPSGEFAACVARIRVEGRDAVWEPHSVAGMASIGLPKSIFVEQDVEGNSVLWIGGTKSVLRHVVTGAPTAPKPRPPLLHAFARSHDGARQPIRASLPFSTSSIEFEFSAPELSRRATYHLQTFIEGTDHEWVAAGADSRRTLTALRDGRYTFRVRTVAETGIASDPTVFSFEILPPVWRTRPFIFGIIALFIPIGYTGYLFWIRRLQRRNAELEAKVQERTEELVQANAAKTEFVANMSHDIRNPLNGIVGLALALEDTSLDPRQHEIVATLRECTTYLSSLVDDVLDFASIEAGRVELRPTQFVPLELLRSIVETLKADTAESGAQLTIDVGSEVPPSLMGDAGRIQQILVNFVSNALKYAGGHIQLTARVPVDSTDEIEFAVTDQGAGLTAAERTTLFTKFSRLKQKRGGEEIPGAGLGLAACRLLADIMGGSVGVDSEPGEGARFFLRLPLAIATAPLEPTAEYLPNASVLLVEDTDYNAWAATAVLGKLGLTCERARTGEEAVRLFAEKRFNIVLLDRNLPDIDGTEVARRIRGLESEGPPAVLLAVTAYCTAEDRALCLEAGMDAFVGKPLTPEKLRKVLIGAGRRMLAGAPLAAPMEKTSPRDEPTLGLLAKLSDGSSESLGDEIRRFLAALETTESQLAALLGHKDFPRVAAAAHNLRSQALMVGSSALAQAAWELESDAKVGDAPACHASAQLVRAEIKLLTAAMRHHPASLHST